MNYYLNELSLKRFQSRAEIPQVMHRFAKTCMALGYFGLDSLRFTNVTTLVNIELCEEYRLYDWLKDTGFDIELRRKIKSIIARSFFCSIDEVNSTCNQFAICDYFHCNNKCNGLAMAFVNNSIAISFGNNDVWEKSKLLLTEDSLDEGGMLIKRNIEVRNAADINHLYCHLDWLFEIDVTFRGIRSSNYFPYKDLVKEVIKENWADFHSRLKRMSENERIAEHERMAHIIARWHGYKPDSKVKRKNNRLVFKTGKSNSTIYLSLDKKSGTFEVCDSKGLHLGEFNFAGEKVDSLDIRGHHNIIV